MSKRGDRLFVRVSEAEKEELNALAQSWGYNEFSSFVRGLPKIFERLGMQAPSGESIGSDSATLETA